MSTIQHEYTFSEDESTIIKDNFSDHLDWGKNVFDSIKKNIIEHLRKEQYNKCCYCKKELGFDLKNVDIEHIIPKSSYPQFTFYGRNLALSCPGCNTIKGMKNVLSNNIVRYPQAGNRFKIIHPHYDRYSNHIRIEKDSVYIALTTKGSETITYCELFRLQNVEKRAKKFQATQQSPIAALTEALRTCSQNERNDFLNEIRKILE